MRGRGRSHCPCYACLQQGYSFHVLHAWLRNPWRLGLGHHPFEVAATAILATAMCGSPSLTPQVTLSSVSGAVTNSARLHSADGWEHILWRFALALVWPARRGAAVLIAQIHGQLSLTFERATFRCTLHVDSPTRARHPHIPALVAAF